MGGYNPFAMLAGKISGEPVLLRPVSFDSSDYDKNYMKSDGSYIKPTMVITTCPKCSSLIEHSLTGCSDITSCIDVVCIKCSPPSTNIPFPFEDPFATSRLNNYNINPDCITDVRLNQKTESPIKKQNTPTEDNKMSTIESLFRPQKRMGLGEFINKRNEWRKINKISEKQEKIDVFDIMGNIPEHNPPNNIL